MSHDLSDQPNIGDIQSEPVTSLLARLDEKFPPAAIRPPFETFPKIPRYNRSVVVTEKIDGTNAQIMVFADGAVLAGSRNRWITPEDDNFGFARWVKENEEELRLLGVGRHYGEWWGSGIQRRYGLEEKRFSLFNTHRWNKGMVGDVMPRCVSVVPVLAHVTVDQFRPLDILESLKATGSVAAPGFMDPEGIVIYHTAGRHYSKMTFDDAPKGGE